MFTRLVVCAVVFTATATLASATPSFIVRWAEESRAPEVRALVEQVDQQLREELQRRGDLVDTRNGSRRTIVLNARLEVLPGALRLHVVGLRGDDRTLLGSISSKASGASRAAQLRAVVRQVCAEAALMQER